MTDLRFRTIAFLCLLTLARPLVADPPVAGAPAEVAPPSSPEDFARLTELLEAAQARFHIPGLSIAVVRDGEVIYARGFGVRNRVTEAPATADTLYAIGSTTKAFTSALIAMLVDEGRMAWDDPVRRHLPDFTLHDADATAEVTIRDLLCHRSGLMATDIMWYGGTPTWDDVQAAIARAEPTAPLRSTWQYQNVMYLTAGRASAAAAETTWENLLRQRLFEPLGMKRANISIDTLAADADAAQGYVWEDAKVEPNPIGPPIDVPAQWRPRPARRLDAIAPAGAINASVNEMASWVRLQLERGRHGDLQLITPVRFDEMWAGQITTSLGADYTLGWLRRPWRGRMLLEHGGGIDGYTAHVALLPELRLGYVMLANLDTCPLPGQSADLVFGALVESSTPDEPIILRDENKHGPYLGVYRLGPPLGELTVLEQDGALAVDVPGQQVYELLPPNEDGHRLFRGFEHIAVSFDANDAGEITSMTLHQGGLALEAPKKGVEIVPEIDMAAAQRYLGRYRFDAMGVVVEALMQNGRLAVEVPGQPIYELRPPDEEAWRTFRATDGIRVRFNEDEEGRITSLTMQQQGVMFEMPRVGGEADVALPSAADVMELVHEELGTDAYLRWENFRMTGRITFVNQGVSGTVTLTASGFDRQLMDIDLGPFGWAKMSTVGWYGYSHSTFAEYELLKGRQLKQLQVQHPAVMHAPWQAFFSQIDVEAATEEDGHPRLELEVGHELLKPIRLIIGADDGRLHRTEGWYEAKPGTEFAVTTYFENYRETDGVWLPFRLRTKDKARGEIVMQFEAIERNLEFADEPWYLPEPDKAGE